MNWRMLEARAWRRPYAAARGRTLRQLFWALSSRDVAVVPPQGCTGHGLVTRAEAARWQEVGAIGGVRGAYGMSDGQGRSADALVRLLAAGAGLPAIRCQGCPAAGQGPGAGRATMCSAGTGLSLSPAFTRHTRPLAVRHTSPNTPVCAARVPNLQLHSLHPQVFAFLHTQPKYP